MNTPHARTAFRSLVWKTFILVIAAGCIAGDDPVATVVAQHDSFDDFIKGTCGNSGANLYVSRKGRVQVINKWDLNKDGHVDVIIPNDHAMTEVADALIYWNRANGFKSLMPQLPKERSLAQLVFGLLDSDQRHFTRLPAFGGGRAIVADLNRDGFADIVFCNYIHNYPGVRAAFIYWGDQDGFKASRKSELPTNWASGVAAADLNGDNYLDLVFANNGTEPKLESISPATSGDAFIYWNSPTGFDASRRAVLKTGISYDVSVADFNSDGRPDIAFACTAPENQGIKIFWGSAKRYADTRVEDFPTAGPVSLQAGDVNKDGIDDLAVSVKEGFALIHLGGKNGLDTKPSAKLPAPDARNACIADLNADGWSDIAIAVHSRDGRKSTNSLVYWGSRTGFEPDRRTELPTLGAKDVSAADLNGDGHTDLVFANSGDNVTYDVQSYIYWGSESGFTPYLRSDLQGFGAVSARTADLDGDGKTDILLVNQNSGGDYNQGLHTNIFWGNPHNYYSTASITPLPAHCPYGILAADVDDDGFNDILFTRMNDVAYGDDRLAPAWLYRGGADGFTTTRRSDIPVRYRAYTVHAADLNRDGYLDLTFASVDQGKNAGIILWGSEDAYSESRKTVLPVSMEYLGMHQIADLNRDGWLDLIFIQGYIGDPKVFWGSKNGFSTQNCEVLKVGAGPMALADFNGDGQLDFVVGGQLDPKTKFPTEPTRIFWGRGDGRPQAQAAFKVEGHEVGQLCVADLNRDGYLDIAQSNYKAKNTRSVPVFVYWGGKDGKYLNSRRTELPAESALGLQTIDLNRDGYPEIIVHNHVKDGEHVQTSFIYWNGPKGFNPHRRTELPTFGAHYSQMIDAGNLYTRKLEEEYISTPIKLPGSVSKLRLSWKAEETPGSRLKTQVRYASTQKELSAAKWTGPSGEGTFFEKQPAAQMSVPTGSLVMQYRALFTSADGGEWPILTEINFLRK
ncbi:MAG: VCBS repeat-containing protein [Pirellulales bacterium]|nr:VCBS repeat-containing protein [Pirellulales bacterium]